jgi:hypothetical protein
VAQAARERQAAQQQAAQQRAPEAAQQKGDAKRATPTPTPR